MLYFWVHLHVGVRCETEELNYTAYEGGQVRIRCPYKLGYKEKYFCKGDAKIPFEAGQSRKFLLHDNTSAHIFTLTITHLELEDKGTYWCVRRGNSSSDIYGTTIQLDIKPGEHFVIKYNDLKSVKLTADELLNVP